MIRKNKVIAGVLLFTVLLAGIPEGFGPVSYVYAEEPVASGEATTESEPESEIQTPKADETDPDEADPDEAAPSEEEKKKSSDEAVETEKKEDTSTDEQEDEKKEEYPSFKQSKTVNGVNVTVEADAGVFPEDAKLSVTGVSSSETEKEVRKERDDDRNVAVSYTFDIKVLDGDDNELQPSDDQNVKVSFRTAEVSDPNLEVSVYHVPESGEGAEELDVSVSGQTATAESDGFSYYTVEFTYNDLQYVLNGDESVALSEILSTVGLAGDASEVAVSDPELFSASKENGKWIITAHKAFSSDEWMRVTLGDITYEISVTDTPTASGTCGDHLNWVLENGILTISGTGAMYDWPNPDQGPAPWYGSIITRVVINSGVTSIGIGAFYNCRSLTSIEIPSGVMSIGADAFSGCANLTNIDIPNSVTSIGGGAFYNCVGLTSIDIPNSVTSIGDSTFSRCTSLTSIEIPSGVTSIGSSAFYYCASLTSIEIPNPNSVTSMGNSVFTNCASLTSIEIPSGVTSIGTNAFTNCTSLTSVTIGNNVTSIGTNAFSRCTSLRSIDIPNSVTSIGANAFYGCTGLRSIDIPNSVTSIETCTFEYCTNLSSVTIGNGVTSIGDSAFANCALTSITIPGSVTSIGTNAFFGCTGLRSIDIPNSVTSIGGYAFQGCTGLTSIEIPSGVTSIGTSTFDNCTNLSSVTIPNGVTSIGTNAFSRCTSLRSIEIPNSVASIGGGAFSGCGSLTSIEIPSGVTSIGTNVFDNCNLTTIYYSGNSPEVIAQFPYGVRVVSNFFISHIDDYRYDGSAYNPVPTVTYATQLTKDTDYTLSYQMINGTTWEDVTDVIDVGTYRAKVTGKLGSYYDGMEVYSNEFSITGQIHSITFYANNKTGVTAVQNAEKGTPVSLRPNDFSYDGYKFKEWNEKADGSGKRYKDKESVTVNADMSLYAIWEKNESKTYSVMVISLIGGTAEADKQKGTEGEIVRLSARADKGYDFKEWLVEAGGVDLSDKTDEGATFNIKTADVCVKAVFVKREEKDDEPAHSEPEPSNPVNPNLLFGVVYTNGSAFPGAVLLKEIQGPLGIAAFRAGRPAGFSEAFSFNMIVNGKTDYTVKKGVLCLNIPAEYQKAGRTFMITALDTNGKVHIYYDLDDNPATITCNIDIDGYAFDLIYRE